MTLPMIVGIVSNLLFNLVAYVGVQLFDLRGLFIGAALGNVIAAVIAVVILYRALDQVEQQLKTS